jgi:hypothetical protein
MKTWWTAVACVGVATMLGIGAAGQQPKAKKGSDLEAQVKKQLDRLGQERAAAEWELLKLGPDILPLLDKAPAGVKDKLDQVRATLEDLKPRTWSVKKSDLTLRETLKGLQDATGLALVDRRQEKTDPRVTVDFQNKSYWEVVESLLRQTDSRLYLYSTDGQVALIDGPARPTPLRLHGPFRVAVKRVSTKLDLESKSHVFVLGLEIAWEPRFAPYLIEVGKVTAQAGRAKGPIHEAAAPGQGPILVPEKNAKEFDVYMAAPPRAVATLESVEGHFVVTMPSRTLALEFKKGFKEKEAQADPTGVIVSVTKIDTGKKGQWMVELGVEVPAAGPKFESHQVWFENKMFRDRLQCHLERGAGANKEILRADPLQTNVTARGTQAVISYRFTAKHNPGVPVEDFSAWKLVCEVPGRMVEVTVPFAFTGVELP